MRLPCCSGLNFHRKTASLFLVRTGLLPSGFIPTVSLRPMRLLRKLILIPLLILTAQAIFASTPLWLSEKKQSVNITSHLEYFRTTDTSLSISAIQSRPFRRWEKKGFLQGFSDDIHWLRLTVASKDSNLRFFEWQSTLAEYIDVYIPGPGHSYKILKGGSFRSAAEKDMKGSLPAFRLELLPDQPQTFYIRIQSRQGFYATLTESPLKDYEEKVRAKDRLEWAFDGILIFKVLFVTILAIFVIRQKAFRLFAFHTFLVSATVWGFSGLIGDLLTTKPQSAAILNTLPYYLLPVSMVLVTAHVIPVRKSMPAPVTYVLALILVVTLLLCLALIFDYRALWLQLVVWNLLACEIFCMSVFIYAHIRKIPFNTRYTAPFFLSFTGYLLLQLRLLGIVDMPWINTFSLLCIILEILVFIFFLVHIIQTFEKEKNQAALYLREERLQAQKQEEMDALKSGFIANLSHEFRTPLTLLMSPTEELKKKYPREKALDTIQKNAARLLTLINQLLDISKLERGELKPEIYHQDLRDFVRRHGGAFTSLAKSKNISFHIRVPETSPETFFDPEKLLTVLNNLLSNAFKFTSAGQEVNLSLSYTTSGKKAIIRVEDSGIGIPPEHIGRIFDRFYQADQTINHHHEGSGIGLALARELTLLMKGSLTVESRENEGTRLTLKIPVDRQSWQQDMKEETRENQAFLSPLISEASAEITEKDTAEGPALLIIDDNADIRASLTDIFEEEYRILEATDGQEGLNKAIIHLPDLVICDLMMPVLNGSVFCKLLKSNETTVHIPVLMLTTESPDEGSGYDAEDYLMKPFHTDEIKARVKNLLRKRE